jgi:hypothetical protein
VNQPDYWPLQAWLHHMTRGEAPRWCPSAAAVSAAMPLDHMYDYGGFMEATDRVYGRLPVPAAAARHHVCVVGGGVAGVMAADGLNRAGVRVTLLEQAGAIGGRLKTVRKGKASAATSRSNSGASTPSPALLDDLAHEQGDAGPDLSLLFSPTPMEMGAMRFAPNPGNSFYRLITHYRLPTARFPNPAAVPTLYLVGNDVFDAGSASDHAASMAKDAEGESWRIFAPLPAKHGKSCMLGCR